MSWPNSRQCSLMEPLRLLCKSPVFHECWSRLSIYELFLLLRLITDIYLTPTSPSEPWVDVSKRPFSKAAPQKTEEIEGDCVTYFCVFCARTNSFIQNAWCDLLRIGSFSSSGVGDMTGNANVKCGTHV